MMELYNIRSLLIACDFATVFVEENQSNSYVQKRFGSADISNITDVATQRLEDLIEKIDLDSIKQKKSGC